MDRIEQPKNSQKIQQRTRLIMDTDIYDYYYYRCISTNETTLAMTSAPFSIMPDENDENIVCLWFSGTKKMIYWIIFSAINSLPCESWFLFADISFHFSRDLHQFIVFAVHGFYIGFCSDDSAEIFLFRLLRLYCMLFH